MSFNSKKYWNERYSDGGNSGAGSYGRLAKFKADYINTFIKQNNINSVIDFGCGDANQLDLYEMNKYIGLDVSAEALTLCISKFHNDKTKSFFLYDQSVFVDNNSIFSTDLSMSIDVIFHLVEASVFEKYMTDLFNASEKYVIIYASNHDESPEGTVHVRHRKFTMWIENNISGWELLSTKENAFPLKNDPENESFASFFTFKKIQ